MVEGKEQISATIDNHTFKTILQEKADNKVSGVSEYIQQACDFYSKYRGVNKKDVMIFIIYPWIIAVVFFLWSQDPGGNITLHIVLFYINFIIFGLVIASIYYIYDRHKKED